MICLDFDGVIADSLPLWEDACRRAAAEQGRILPPEARPFAWLDPLTFKQLATDLGLDPEAFDARMAELGLAAIATARPFEGVAEMLAELAAHDDLYVVSASRTGFIRAFLDRHGLSQTVTEVFGGDRHNGKAGLLSSLETVRAMVGDAKSDIDAARKAGVKSVAALWGWQDAEMLAEADDRAQRPRDLIGLLTP